MKQYIDMSDEELVIAYRHGDQKCFQELYKRYQRKIFSYILVSVKNKEITNDIFQEVFFKVINTIQSGNYREEGKFAQWIIRITHNAVIDHFRYQNKYATSPSCEDDDDGNYVFDNISVNNYTSPEDILIKKENKVLIQQAVSTLSKKQQEVIYLRLNEDKCFREIANAQNISINTALGRMRYAIMNVKKKINPYI
ncbi:MAG TPA: sigma-70 family RNA polymerase sigma factor [Bacteroidales bacterium]|jgi:RNA polymerase sigma-70 factor (ECF subfamily)|nr:sigma-70 family RNA polymerase sigma factor [Bacteroidales bacterium]HOJ24892.1 sigma-70 family RNA polymerase sigma factor [Bacteroidales bacterium]HOV55650.1 sigma-70 family RNA polymerase sigma factor [Bacteroidales bacterium]HPB20559.1 sigma-70 family RNA polymerase sigma factor [Bacteroidales bacterium]HPX46325.1 sigma-70 family RNA polymerase sigma factor [Bacteroidales bacterium]